jgi:hypothetical protein
VQRARGAAAVAAQSRFLGELVTRFFAAFVITINLVPQPEYVLSVIFSEITVQEAQIVEVNVREPVATGFGRMGYKAERPGIWGVCVAAAGRSCPDPDHL